MITMSIIELTDLILSERNAEFNDVITKGKIPTYILQQLVPVAMRNKKELILEKIIEVLASRGQKIDIQRMDITVQREVLRNKLSARL